MQFQDHVLIGWTIMYRVRAAEIEHSGNGDRDSAIIPRLVFEALLERGWIEQHPQNADRVRLTENGIAITDLYAPEWGIDSLAAASGGRG